MITALVKDYSKVQGELQVTKTIFSPYVEVDEDKEVVYLDGSFNLVLEEEQRVELLALFKAQIAAFREQFEWPRGTLRGVDCMERKYDPKDGDGTGTNHGTTAVAGSNPHNVSTISVIV